MNREEAIKACRMIWSDKEGQTRMINKIYDDFEQSGNMFELKQYKNDVQFLQQQNAELTHEILELREEVRRLETKEFIDNMDKEECDYGVATKIDEETWNLEQNNKHMSEVIKYLERKLKEQE